MSQQNLIELAIPPADLAAIEAAVATLSDKLLPHLKTVSAQDRMELARMGDKTVAFVQKGFEYAGKNPSLVPSYLDLSAMENDLETVARLRNLHQHLGPLVLAIEDSLMLAGSDAYQSALMFYNAAKAAGKAKVGNSLAIYNDLASRFPGAGSAAKAVPAAVK